MRVLSIGEILWDHCGTQRTLGGAPLNFSAHMSRLGNEVAILSAVGRDDSGDEAVQNIKNLGVDLRFLQTSSEAATGSTSVVLSPNGEPTSRINRPAAYDFVKVDTFAMQEIGEYRPDWLYIGTLFHLQPEFALRTVHLRRSMPHLRVFYDINLRPDNWSLPLVKCLSSHANIVKLNESEAHTLAEASGFRNFDASPEGFCHQWLRIFDLECVCLTLGAAGCLLVTTKEVLTIPCAHIQVLDPLGAGDAFSAGFVHAWHHGLSMEHSGRVANYMGGLVARKIGAIPEWSEQERELLQEQFALQQNRDGIPAS
ncbi:carbohydrate kinase family protein [Terriglobus sp. TAA 43]|uniref:carbohydrate kinase family protein n=1 Tax=Terriglobus sp. TAA 43 TaxID=278961 RepID=UPI000648E26A|nr:PfkB family carbohydrate kinase [Terriglobus sp. TAA 43]